MFWFQIYCQFDSGYLFDYTLLMLFNLVFTSLGVAVLGIVRLDHTITNGETDRCGEQFDRDVSPSTVLAFPQLYVRGVKGLEYTRARFFAFMFDGLYQSAVCYFLPYCVFAWSTSWTVEGHDGALAEFGTTVAACAVTACNLYVGMHIRNWTWMVYVIIFGSILSFHVWIAIYSVFPTFALKYEIVCAFSSLSSFETGGVATDVIERRPVLDTAILDVSYPHSGRLHRAEIMCPVHLGQLLPDGRRHRSRARSQAQAAERSARRRRARHCRRRPEIRQRAYIHYSSLISRRGVTRRAADTIDRARALACFDRTRTAFDAPDESSDESDFASIRLAEKLLRGTLNADTERHDTRRAVSFA